MVSSFVVVCLRVAFVASLASFGSSSAASAQLAWQINLNFSLGFQLSGLKVEINLERATKKAKKAKEKNDKNEKKTNRTTTTTTTSNKTTNDNQFSLGSPAAAAPEQTGSPNEPTRNSKLINKFDWSAEICTFIKFMASKLN